MADLGLIFTSSDFLFSPENRWFEAAASMTARWWFKNYKTGLSLLVKVAP